MEAVDPTQTVLAVTHGIFLRFLLIDTLLGPGFSPGDVGRLWLLRTTNCGLSELVRGEPRHPADPEIDGLALRNLDAASGRAPQSRAGALAHRAGPRIALSGMRLKVTAGPGSSRMPRSARTSSWSDGIPAAARARRGRRGVAPPRRRAPTRRRGLRDRGPRLAQRDLRRRRADHGPRRLSGGERIEIGVTTLAAEAAGSAGETAPPRGATPPLLLPSAASAAALRLPGPHPRRLRPAHPLRRYPPAGPQRASDRWDRCWLDRGGDRHRGDRGRRDRRQRRDRPRKARGRDQL